MQNHKTATRNTTDVTLTHTELLRLKRWYQTYASDDSVDIDQADILLDAKLRDARYDMQDRSNAGLYAMRDLHSTKQHVGPERRAREELVRIRVKRPAIKLTLTH